MSGVGARPSTGADGGPPLRVLLLVGTTGGGTIADAAAKALTRP